MALLSPIEWGPGRKQAFLEWIQLELSNTIGDRADLEREWENRILQWRAKLTEDELDFPYPGASNYELPLTAIHSDPVYADMMQSLHAPEDYWSATAKRQDRVDFASALRRGMTALDTRFLKMRRVNSKALLDNIVLGTAVYKNNWRSERVGKRRYRPDGSSERRIVSISQPLIEHIPIQRVFFPAYAWSTDFDAQGGTRWIAQEFRFNEEEFDRYKGGSAELPGWDKEAADMVSKHFVDENEKIRRQTQEDDKFVAFEELHAKVYEVWARFDVAGDGVWEDIVVQLHRDGPWMLRGVYFPNSHGKHAFHFTNYLPGMGILGIGMAEVDEWAQEASTDLLNAQIDNARLANTRMYKAPLGANFQQGSAIYPGKVWYLGPDEDVGEVRLSELYPSGFTLLQNLMQFSELRSGVSELRQGNLSGLPSRTPATSLLSILREGNKRFDMIHANFRDVHGEMGLRMMQNVAQRAQEDPQGWLAFFAQAIGETDAAKILEVLTSAEVDEIEEAFGISVTATSAQVNKEVEKQSFIGMLQITQQIYQALVQTAILMAQVPDPIVQETAKAAFASGVDILAQLFERFDVKNPQEHLGNLEALATQLQADGAQPNAELATLIGRNGLGALGGRGGPPQALDPNVLAQIFGL